MAKRRKKGRPVPSRRKGSERAEVMGIIVQAMTKGLVGWFFDAFIEWISKGGRL